MLLKTVFLLGLSLLASDVTWMDVKKLDFSFAVAKHKETDWRCFLRGEAAEALLHVQKVMQITGNRIKLVECYIPESQIKKEG
ncbi:MAG: hypothetical protein ACKN9V_05785, partial [Pseudomonadota bacterium]